MELSKAIRLGIGLFPQGTGWHNCVLGTALAAIGRNWHYSEELNWPCAVVVEEWPWLLELAPSGCNWFSTLQAMNGFRSVQTSREAIAAFVEALETQRAHTVVQAPTGELHATAQNT